MNRKLLLFGSSHHHLPPILLVFTSSSQFNKETKMANSDSFRFSELKAFDETKAGVKGLVDAAITNVPPIFHHPAVPSQDLDKTTTSTANFSFPVIDLEGVDRGAPRRKEIVDKVREASETWGFFRVVNHGISLDLLEEMKDGVKKFHEQDKQLKKEFFCRDYTKKVVYNSNFDLYSSPAANWRDTVTFLMAPDPPKPDELPAVCR